MHDPFEDLIQFKDNDGKDLRFVNYEQDKQAIMAWHIGENTFGGQGNANLMLVHVGNVSQKTLEHIGLWNELPEDIKVKIESKNVKTPVKTVKASNSSNSPKKQGAGKRGRQPDPRNAGIPKEITCTKCNTVRTFQPSITRKKCEELGVSVEHYVTNFVCNPCLGIKRGRKPKK